MQLFALVYKDQTGDKLVLFKHFKFETMPNDETNEFNINFFEFLFVELKYDESKKLNIVPVFKINLQQDIQTIPMLYEVYREKFMDFTSICESTFAEGIKIIEQQ